MNDTNNNDTNNLDDQYDAQDFPRVSDDQLLQQGHSCEVLEDVRIERFKRDNGARFFMAVYRRLSYDNGASYNDWKLLEIF